MRRECEPEIRHTAKVLKSESDPAEILADHEAEECVLVPKSLDSGLSARFDTGGFCGR